MSSRSIGAPPQIDPRISIATVYRTVRLFEEANILARHDFGDGRSRYEEMPSAHHDHLIDLQTGRVIEFRNEEIEKLQQFVADQLGYDLVGHRLELYAVPRDGKPGPTANEVAASVRSFGAARGHCQTAGRDPAQPEVTRLAS